MKILIIGCGLSGAVMAERFANKGHTITILEKRDHIAGNVFDYIDPSTEILISKYGAHLFHTNNEKVWKYINKFSNWIRWDHQVLGYVDGKYINIPVNINTVNALCNEHIENTEEMNKWLDENQVKYNKITNSEEMGKSRVGNILYNKIFKNYTYKQWAKYPEELDASVLERIPIRNNFDTRYFSDKYQVLPEKGYTKFVENIIHHENISIKLNYEFDINTFDYSLYDTVIFTGPIDQFYKNSNLEKLEYRSIDFKIERYDTYYFQPNSVVNYPSLYNDFTRIVEYKHFLNQQKNSKQTIIVKEFSKDKGEPYYPVPNDKNKELYEKYKLLANKELNVHFLGRLANYKYFNMDTAILNALNYFEQHFEK